MTNSLPTADQVFRRSLELLQAKDITGWLTLCADDVVIDFPFAPDGYPSQLNGKADVAAYMKDYPDLVDLQNITALESHPIDHQDRVVVEWTGEGLVVATGTPYTMAYVAIVTVKNGLMTHYRDYWNPLGLPSSFSQAKTRHDGGVAV